MRLIDKSNNKIYKLILNMKLRTRMILTYSISTLLVIAIMSTYFYTAMLDLSRSKERVALKDSLDYMSNLINIRISTINQHFINIFQEENFRNLYFQSQNKKHDDIQQLNLATKFGDYFVEVKGKDNDILAGIILSTNNGYIFSDNYQSQYSYEAFLETDYRKQTIQNKNKVIFLDSANHDRYFAMARSFYYVGNTSPYSMSVGMGSEKDSDYSTLVFLLRKSYIDNLVKKVAERHDAAVMMLDDKGNVVLKSGVLEAKMIDEYIDHIKTSSMDESGSYLFNGSGYNLIVNYEQIKYSNWHIVMISNESTLLRDTGRILTTVLLIVFIALILTSAISYFVSKTVVKPIKKLVDLMDGAVESNMDISYSVKYNDEIAHLCSAFNKMVCKIREMILDIKKQEQLKRKEELRALQAQINPHFLYNTLDMVYMLAKTEKNEKIANIVADLGDFFRLSLNKGEDVTTVNNEIEHAIKYLSIQKTRWSKKFDYEVHVEEELRSKAAPKLILQPIIENALVHGLYDVDYKGLIVVRVYSDKDNIVFSVEDNGAGISNEIIGKILRGEKLKTSKSGYALRNVQERIQLYVGEEHCINISQRVEGGTKVNITFPLDFQIREV
jgi:two-component system sensor histidine kinase YesM